MNQNISIRRVRQSCTLLPSGCWEWARSVDSSGRPNIRSDGVHRLVSHYVYEATHGKLRGEISVTCGNTKCCNPDHFKIVETSAQSIAEELKVFPSTQIRSRPPNLDGKELLAWLLQHYTRTDEHGCMIWQKHIQDNGYGQVHYSGRKYVAHRLTWALSNDDFKSLENSNLVVRHCCPLSVPNKACCNPAHLKIGTKSDNEFDKTLENRVESLDTIIDWLWIYETFLNESGNPQKRPHTYVARGLRQLGLVKPSTKESYVVDILRGDRYKHLHEHFFDWTPVKKSKPRT